VLPSPLLSFDLALMFNLNADPVDLQQLAGPIAEYSSSRKRVYGICAGGGPDQSDEEVKIQF
jgi:hypothetical protein